MKKRREKQGKKERFSVRLLRQRIPLVTLLALLVGGAMIGVSYWYSSSQIDSSSSSGAGASSSSTILTGITEQPTKGYLHAPVTIVEFSEFYCPYCARFAFNTLPKIVEEYVEKGLVKIVFRNFPVHGELAILAAMGGECAHEQGRFWDYHDKLFTRIFKENQRTDKAALIELAAELGLDVGEFKVCLNSERHRESVEEDIAEGQRLGVRGTPSFSIDGRLVVGAQPFEVFQKIIEEELERSGE